MIRYLFGAAALVPFVLGGQTPATAARSIPPALPIDRVVAIVGDQPLLWTDVVTSINQRRAQGLQLPADSVGQAALARTVLGELIDEEILVQKAKEMKLEVTECGNRYSADRQIKQIRSQFKSDDEYKAELRNAGLGTPDEYRKSLIEQFRRQSLQQKAFAELRKSAKPVNVADEDVTKSVRAKPDGAAEASGDRHVQTDHRRATRFPGSKSEGEGSAIRCSPRSAKAATSSRSPSANRWIPARRRSVATSAGIGVAADSFPSLKR